MNIAARPHLRIHANFSLLTCKANHTRAVAHKFELAIVHAPSRTMYCIHMFDFLPDIFHR